MEDVPFGEMKPSFQKILDVARCAICLETVRPEIVQCVKGHLLCGECRRGLRHCPTCRQPFSSAELSLVLRQMLDALPKRCKYTNCKIYLKHADDHEKWCGFQPTSCKINLCHWTGPSRDIFSHIRKKHPTTWIMKAMNKTAFLPNFDNLQNSKRFIPIIAHGQFFWGEGLCDYDKEMLMMTYHLVPSGNKPMDDYLIEMSFTSRDSFIMVKFKFDFEQNKVKNSVFVPRHSLSNFVDEHGRLQFQLFIMKQQREVPRQNNKMFD
uniref:RING-type domain-containing protein n=1 Tax=Graphocephala atropunctata TaxID=36148 RepID=A0A1B6KVK6_9HEMI